MNIKEELNSIFQILNEEKYTDREKYSAVKAILYPSRMKGRIQKYSLIEIAKQIEKFTGISLDQINRLNRADSDVVLARQLAHYKAMKFSQVPFEIIGLYFGHRDHSSVFHSIKVIDGYLKFDKAFNAKYDHFLNN